MQKMVYLKDYKEPDYFISEVNLEFDVFDEYTIVSASLKMDYRLPALSCFAETSRGNDVEKSGNNKSLLKLNGEDLELFYVAINGEELTESQYEVDAKYLTLKNVPQEFMLSTKVKIYPANNKRLEGLYKSKNIFCTQCEAQGFRRITYYLDRPDVLAKFTVAIKADKKYGALLSNGNLVETSDIGADRHFAKWKDPSLKPCYLFALVIGELAYLEDFYVTQSGRTVALRLYSEKNKVDDCRFALNSLKKAMRWDEKIFKREYDLDIYMIVAISDFNAGAMENKGLNIFNVKYVLANKETATDDDYINIEAVVAHEYFHNWTGNRITCRDWFQLSLKEGLTVFRDQWFTADQISHPIKRIRDVSLLRSRQFAEDASPLAHPVQPKSYLAIDNFYTVTVYEKGAEVVRMLYTFLGEERFLHAMQEYFAKFDGQAVTIEDFAGLMCKHGNLDFNKFRRWYDEAGTPNLAISDEYDAASKTYRLIIKQNREFLLPFKVGLLNRETGQELSKQNEVLTISRKTEVFNFNNIAAKPIPSLLRDFSAPVNLSYPYTLTELLFLFEHDSNEFNRWDAGQRTVMKIVLNILENNSPVPNLYIDIFQRILTENNENKNLTAEFLTLPTSNYLINQLNNIFIPDLLAAMDFINSQIAAKLSDELLNCYQSNKVSKDGRRLKNLCLHYLAYADQQLVVNLVVNQYQNSDNITDKLEALDVITDIDCAEREELLHDFLDKWQHDELMLAKWFVLQAKSKLPGSFAKIKAILNSEIFDLSNPNSAYSLLRTFAVLNHANFHKLDGSGYQLLADQVLLLDKINPQVAARLITPLTNWRALSISHQELMRKELNNLSQQKLSSNLYEVVNKSL
ncbi:MAG: aminopeptidase N [Gammaproteobacteria bacterium]|nr:aminopeptidase N [Gammaproteobacteria bacterium]